MPWGRRPGFFRVGHALTRMQFRSVAASLAAGVAAFLLVGVAVTELAASRIEFSLFLGLPAGIGAGALAMTVVLLTVEDVRPGRRRLGLAVGTFGVVFLVGLLVAAFVLRLGAVTAIAVGVVLGVFAAIGGWLSA